MNKLNISLEEQDIVMEVAEEFDRKKFLTYKNLLQYIRKYGEVSFIEIEAKFHDTKGDVVSYMKNSEIIFWTDSSHKLIDIVNLLLKNKKISLIVSTRERYAREGQCLKYPLPERHYDHKRKYWLPILLKVKERR